MGAAKGDDLRKKAEAEAREKLTNAKPMSTELFGKVVFDKNNDARESRRHDN